METVRKAYSDITKSLKSTEFYWIENTLPESIDMLVYAANNMKIPTSRLRNYKRTWLHAENSMYVEQSDESDFVLALNFPTGFNELLNMLYKYRKEENVRIHSAIIDGFKFEERICTTIGQLDVLYSKKDEAVSLQSDLKAITFLFKAHVSNQSSNSPVTGLVDSVLVYLRAGHPVIDAIAYVTVDTTPWLLLIQVFLSE